MIRAQRQLFYFVGDKPYASLEEAQRADIVSLMPDACPEFSFACIDGTTPTDIKNGIAEWMVKNAKEIVDTLTTTPRSRLRARKLHGATRKPKAKPAPANEKT